MVSQSLSYSDKYIVHMTVSSVRKEVRPPDPYSLLPKRKKINHNPLIRIRHNGKKKPPDVILTCGSEHKPNGSQSMVVENVCLILLTTWWIGNKSMEP